MFGRAADIVQIVFGAVFPDVGNQEFRVPHDGTYRCLDVMCHGQHQFLAGNQEVFGSFLGFFQLVAVMVAFGDVTPYDDEKDNG